MLSYHNLLYPNSTVQECCPRLFDIWVSGSEIVLNIKSWSWILKQGSMHLTKSRIGHSVPLIDQVTGTTKYTISKQRPSWFFCFKCSHKKCFKTKLAFILLIGILFTVQLIKPLKEHLQMLLRENVCHRVV